MREPGVWLDFCCSKRYDPKIADNYDVKICDIDGLESDVDTELFKDELIKAGEIIGSYRDDIFKSVRLFRKLVPEVKRNYKID